MISIAAAASRDSSGFPPRASAESTTRRGLQRFPPVLNMYLMIWLASRLSKFAFNVLLIVFSIGSRHTSSEDGNFLISAKSSMSRLLEWLHRYLICCGQHRNHPAELYVDVKNKLYSKPCGLKLQVRKM